MSPEIPIHSAWAAFRAAGTEAMFVMRKVFFSVAALLLALLTLASFLRVVNGGDYLSYVVATGDYPAGRQSAWIWLMMAEVLFAVAGIVGMWVALLRKRYWLVVPFALMQVPFPIIIEASRCDVDNWFCRSFAWASVDRLFW